ncbi:MAG: chromosome segregation protein SMC [Candidatus Aminicenantia bacterium]
MFIKKIELHGFKSFPDRTKILFHPGVTAIVGPNGCGKSNIVDSVLWVLGEQKLKTLRGERTVDIIFNGSSRRAPLGLVDVVMTLGNSDEELIIGHRAFRTGEREYRLNGKQVRLRDIQDALWANGIGEKEYFVIGQGSIEQFVTAKPAEKRVLLEESAGIGKYRERKKQAQNKLIESEQNLIRLEDIIIEVERQKNSLRRQAATARRYRKLREKIRYLSFLYFRQKIAELRKNHQEIVRSYQHLQLKEKDLLSRIKSKEIKLNTKESEIWKVENEIKNFQEKLFSLKSNISQLVNQKEKEEKRKEFLQEKIEKEALNLKELQTELTLIKKDLEKCRVEKEKLTKSYGQKIEELKKIELQFRLKQRKNAELLSKIKQKKELELQIQSELTSIKNELLIKRKELETLIIQKQKLINQTQEEKNLEEKKKNELVQKRKELERFKTSLMEKRKIEEKVEQELKEVLESIGYNQNKLTECRTKIEELTHHLKALKKIESELISLPEVKDYSGIIGPLADFIEVKPDYLIQAESFWKEEIKSLLINRDDFLNIVKRKSEVKGTFLLPKEKNINDFPSKLINNQKVIGFLKSQVRLNQKAEKFSPSLNEAVLVKDIQSAIELWLENPELNFVTLQGDVLLSSGLVRLAQKEDGILSIQKEIKELSEQKNILENSLSSLIQKLEEKNQHRKKLELQKEKESSLISQFEKEFLENETKTNFLDAEFNKMQQRLALFSQELEIMNEEEKDLEERINKLVSEENKIYHQLLKTEKELSVSNQQLTEIQEEIKQISERLIQEQGIIDLIQEKINNLKNQFTSLSERKEKIENKINKSHQEIAHSKLEVEKINQFLNDFSLKHQTLVKEETLLKEKIEEKEIYLKNLRSEYKKKEKEISELRKKYEQIREERMKWEVNKAEVERDLVNLEEKCWQELNKGLSEIEKEVSLEKIEDEAEIEIQLNKAKNELGRFKEVNMMAEEEFNAQKERYDFLTQQKQDLLNSIDSTNQAIKRIDQESKELFFEALSEVDKNFQEIFRILFRGGKAAVKLTDENKPLESGIEIIAQPPGKRLQSLMLLSGGEKTLTSLAFLFALFQYKPSPFCILDEVDATLDDANLERFLNLMKELKDKTQFLIVTHNLKTMEVADYIYGITMAEPNVSSLYSIKLEKK